MVLFNKKRNRMKQTLEEAKENAWNNYEYEEGNLYSTAFKSGFELGVEWYIKNLKEKVRKAIDVIQEIPIDEVSKQGGISALKLILNEKRNT